MKKSANKFFVTLVLICFTSVLYTSYNTLIKKNITIIEEEVAEEIDEELGESSVETDESLNLNLE